VLAEQRKLDCETPGVRGTQLKITEIWVVLIFLGTVEYFLSVLTGYMVLKK